MDQKTLLIKRSDFYEKERKKLNKFTLKLSLKQLRNAVCDGLKNNSIRTLKYTLKNFGNTETEFNSIKSWTKYTINFPTKHLYGNLSGKILIENVHEHLLENKNNNNFVFCHVMDTHYPLNFLSSELPIVQTEIEAFYKNRKKTDGNIFYKLSVEYIDQQIGDLIEKLEKDGEMDNTTIVITGDHGSSFVGNIHRTEITNTFYDENYRIPLLVIDKNKKAQTIDNLSISTQFIPTLLDILGSDYEKEWVESNSILECNKDYIVFEYYGSGCPDPTKRDKLYCIRDRRYKIQWCIL